MATPDLPDRVDLLERLQDQHARVHDQLIAVTARLGEAHRLDAEIVARLNQAQALHGAILERVAYEQSLHAQRMTRSEEILIRLEQASAQQAARLERLDQILQAITDLLPRRNGP